MDKYSSMVQKLLSLSIKLVAVDFDQTIINIHTRGVWQFTSKTLVSRVRPSFKQFFTAMLNCSDLHVAVVTYSPQTTLIREVLEQALPDCDTSRIHYRGTDGNWKGVKGVPKEGKQQHIESVLNQIEKDHKVKIKKKEVILLDDDEKNISVARSCKMKALLIKGDDSLDELLEQRLLLPYEKHVRNQLKKQMDDKNPSSVNSLPQNQPLDKPEKRQGLTVSNKAKPDIETEKAAVLKQNQGAVGTIPTRPPQDGTAVSSLQSSPYMMNTTTDVKGNAVKTTEPSQVHSVTASSVNKTSFKQAMSSVVAPSFKQEHQEPKTCSSKSKTGAAPPITSATEKQNRDTPTEQRAQDPSQQNRNFIKTMQSEEEPGVTINTVYAKNTTASTNLKQSVQAVPQQRVFRGVHNDKLMSPPPQLLNSGSKGREIIDLTSDDSPPGSQSRSHLVPPIQGSQGNAQDMSKMHRPSSGGDTEGRRHLHKSQTRQEYHESSKRHHPIREVQTSGEVSSVYDAQTYGIQPFNNNRVPPQVQDSSPTIKKSKDEAYPLVKQETFLPKRDKQRHQQARVEILEGRYTHSPSSDSADEHFAEWIRRQSSVQHHRPKCSVSHHIQSPNPELGQFRYGYVAEDMCASDCSCSLPTSRKDEIVAVAPPTKPKKEHYEEDLPFPSIAMYPGRWSPSMLTDHPDLYISSHPPHLGVPPDALASHMCTPSRIFIPTPQVFSPPYHMNMAAMGAPPLIAGTDDQLHIHPHCLMASSYPRSSSSRTPDGTGYPLYSFT